MKTLNEIKEYNRNPDNPDREINTMIWLTQAHARAFSEDDNSGILEYIVDSFFNIYDELHLKPNKIIKVIVKVIVFTPLIFWLLNFIFGFIYYF